MTDPFDVIVIGAGPAGEVVAGRCADGGLRVAIVERELVGGECSYWGCIPSKTLLRPGDAVAAARRVPGAAEAVTGPIDVAAALARRDEMTHGWDDGAAVPWLEEHGVTLLRGVGRLTGARRVAIEDTEHEARRAVVIATGTVAAMPPIPGLTDARPWDNRDATAMQRVPARVLVLGGGAIGVEIAQAFKRLGAGSVTVLEGETRLLPREEPFAGDELAAAFAAEGIDVVAGHSVTRVARDAAGEVTASLDDGRVYTGDEMLVAVGRRPATTDLGLESVGLEPGHSIEVDDRLRATGVEGEWLYAVGDCNGRALLTHMGKYQARIASDVILGHDITARADHGIVPRVTFTDPQVCAVGLTVAEARAAGHDVRVVTFPTGDVSGASTFGRDVHGTSQLVIDQVGRTILGATFTGPGLQELLHSATIAIAGEVTLDQLWHAVPSFPTISEVWLRLLEAYGM